MFRIQYAEVVRWKPPIDLASKKFPSGSLHATSFGSCCPQPETSSYMTKPNEQCLYLNIYKPIVPSNCTLLPVLMWIHGGAHSLGCSSRGIPVTYNGTNMIAHSPSDQPVIIITINYRLGVFADMFLKELIKEDPEWPTAGNYMYLDMLSALRWIKRNILDYGGDPTKVSLFGQSAGGLSGIDLGAVKGSAGLYRAVISQSGLEPPGVASAYYTASEALDYSNSIVKRVKCANEDHRKVLACLRSTSIEDLLEAYGDRYTQPIIDNHFFPLHPPLAIQRGTYNDVTLIMGYNVNEYSICSDYPDVDFAKAVNMVTTLVGDKLSSSVVNHYHLKNCSPDGNANTSRCCDIIRLILLNKVFACDIRRLFNAFYSRYGPKYAKNKLFSYHLDCYSETCGSSKKGTCGHADEISFVFGTEASFDARAGDKCTWDKGTREFSNEIISQWINVAVTGKPLNDWSSYNPISPKRFFITPKQDFSSESWDMDCSFFDEIEAKAVREKFGYK